MFPCRVKTVMFAFRVLAMVVVWYASTSDMPATAVWWGPWIQSMGSLSTTTCQKLELQLGLSAAMRKSLVLAAALAALAALGGPGGAAAARLPRRGEHARPAQPAGPLLARSERLTTPPGEKT